MAKRQDRQELKDKMGGTLGGLLASTEPQAQTTETPAQTPPPPTQGDPLVKAVETELKEHGLTGRELELAVIAVSSARRTERNLDAERRARRKWRESAQNYGRPTTYRLPDEIRERVDALAKKNRGTTKADIAAQLLEYALDAVERGDLVMEESD